MYITPQSGCFVPIPCAPQDYFTRRTIDKGVKENPAFWKGIDEDQMLAIVEGHSCGFLHSKKRVGRERLDHDSCENMPQDSSGGVDIPMRRTMGAEQDENT